jgi:hypothetical protein
MKAGAQGDRLARMVRRVGLAQLLLKSNCAPKRLSSGWEFDQSAITQQLRHPAFFGGDSGRDDGSVDRIQRGEQAGSIPLHHAAIVDGVER